MTTSASTKQRQEEDFRGWRSHNGRDYFRPLGESEYAYYIPASRNGLGDMFLHASFTTKSKSIIMDPSRIALCWAITRSRHPLLMSKVRKRQRSTPASINGQLSELISNYLNGPRTLSDERMSYLVISTSSLSTETDDADEGDYDLLMCAPHFIGDGASLHQCTHEFITLLASAQSSQNLKQKLTQPLNWVRERANVDLLPPALESRLSVPSSRLAKAAAKVNYLQSMHNEIGGHTLRRNQLGPQKTVMIEKSFSEEQTLKILAKCKQNGVTVNHALFALCNVAWGQSNLNFKAIREPLMMYTALNLRPYLSQHPSTTYWFLALTYFNVVLPAFVPTTLAAFWMRVRDVKEQTRKVVKSPFLTSRAMRGARVRAERVRGVSAGTNGGPSGGSGASGGASGKSEAKSATAQIRPFAALFGLSLIGNLDLVYRQEEYVAVGSGSEGEGEGRQKPGGFLLLEHTFGKKLWLHLCWDENGFEEGHVESFWECLEDAVEELVIGDGGDE
ncbi:hypothetical protein GYMLUDRAFT_175669 [Collybiopsis luxurians FD-317 M1]|uniref:Diacylglycerol O-acyltransferase n=1 Tax=Collybiopsis luxurians FD-317 M1 TaxID=944289 RepID=A0A0D0BZQ6_9AGAR|nr:hypothetical protein GYMLUDRAFT_175669 [Collybiopsis luxurians FD-317 M1]